ncbi:MAG: 1-acyl-sn-glycerol-3-phosphate acyltransferase [Bacteroidales bacterium]|jgi:1-acyl-sn-glycerol-3-phosphate acyltransferase|nr:1-acyl-sn-glycerol-3-phosphate acyltransferase [Bacteroidales bacterium]
MGGSLFQKVARKSWSYDFLRSCFKFSFTKIYCRRFITLGRKNLPVKGTPMVVVSNHQNGVTDALQILFGFPPQYRPVYLARADVFKKPAIAGILYFLRIMPIYRIRDGKDNLGENEYVFKTAAEIAQKGLPVCMFPEGMHQRIFGHVKKGFARIAFLAAEKAGFPDNFVIMPTATYYSKYYGYRATCVFAFGKPIDLADYYDEYRENPQKAFLSLAEKAEERINEAIVDIEDYNTDKSLPAASGQNKILKILKLLLLGPLAAAGFLLHAIPVFSGEYFAKKLTVKDEILRGGVEYVLCELILTTLFYFIYTALFFVFCPLALWYLYPAFVALLFVSKISWLKLRSCL